jgi:hypothetical protein
VIPPVDASVNRSETVTVRSRLVRGLTPDEPA